LGNWKALHYQAKKAFENVLISAEMKNDSIEIFVINDTFKTISDTLSMELTGFEGRQIFQNKILVESSENSSEVVFTIPMKNLSFDKAASVLKVNFGNSEYLHYFVNPKNLKLLETEIETEIDPDSYWDETEVENLERAYSISLISKTLQKNVFLSADKKGRWSDNYFDLLPNQARTIYFYTNSKTPPRLQHKNLNQLIK
jgi:beta-mannosidase